MKSVLRKLRELYLLPNRLSESTMSRIIGKFQEISRGSVKDKEKVVVVVNKEY